MAELRVTSAVEDNTGTTIRNILVMLAGLLLSRQIISQEFYDQFLSGIPVIIGVLMLLTPWIQSYWAKWKSRDHTERLVEVALDMKKGSTKADLLKIVPPEQTILEKVTGSGSTPLPMILVIVLAAVLATSAIFGTGCASWRTADLVVAPESSVSVKSVKVADRAFVLAGQAFDTAMTLAEDLRRARKIDDATWAKIDAAQKQVNKWSPKVAVGLEYWREFGSRGSFDAAYDEMMKAVTEIQATTGEVQR